MARKSAKKSKAQSPDALWSKWFDIKESGTDQLVDEPLKADELRQSLKDLVAAAYLNDKDILKQLVALYSDRASAREIRRLALPMLKPERAAKKRLEAKWPARTDCDRLDDAFAALEQSGILARQNYWCCGTCGGAAIDDEMTKLAKRRRPARGYTFFHEQDTEFAVQGHSLCLDYGAATRTKKDAVAIGKEIVATLKNHGLKPKWNGRIENRIELPIKWRRRAAK